MPEKIIINARQTQISPDKKVWRVLVYYQHPANGIWYESPIGWGGPESVMAAQEKFKKMYPDISAEYTWE